MDLVGDLGRNLSVDLPSCEEKARGGGQVYKRNNKPANNNKGAARTASVFCNDLDLVTKFEVATPLANRRLFLCTPHLNKIDISMCDGRYLLIALVMNMNTDELMKKHAVTRSFVGSCETRYHKNK